MASNVKKVALATGADTAVSSVTEGVYYGFTIRETAGSTAVVQIFDNTAGSGTLLDSIGLAANASLSKFYGPQGIHVKTGIYVKLVSGAIEGSIRIG